MEVILNLEELRQLCREWQKRLHLENWHILVDIKRRDEFDIEDSQGEIHYQLCSADASISIVDHCDWPTDTLFKQDMEKTLVHELLHIPMAIFEPDEDDEPIKHDLWEQFIETMARNLVSIKREIK